MKFRLRQRALIMAGALGHADALLQALVEGVALPDWAAEQVAAARRCLARAVTGDGVPGAETPAEAAILLLLRDRPRTARELAQARGMALTRRGQSTRTFLALRRLAAAGLVACERIKGQRGGRYLWRLTEARHVCC
jgi:hypothetical protein